MKGTVGREDGMKGTVGWEDGMKGTVGWEDGDEGYRGMGEWGCYTCSVLPSIHKAYWPHIPS